MTLYSVLLIKRSSAALFLLPLLHFDAELELNMLTSDERKKDQSFLNVDKEAAQRAHLSQHPACLGVR